MEQLFGCLNDMQVSEKGNNTFGCDGAADQSVEMALNLKSFTASCVQRNLDLNRRTSPFDGGIAGSESVESRASVTKTWLVFSIVTCRGYDGLASERRSKTTPAP
nr:hypothetical protein CFP56_59612 [Quercus suber]